MNLPIEFLDRMKKMLNNDFDNFISSYNSAPLNGLRLNQLKNTAFLKSQLKNTIPWTTNGYYYDASVPYGKMPYHNMGLYYIQEPSAMLPAVVLNQSENDTVLDLCAAPGGKSTQIALSMNNSGLLISNEIISKRSLILKDNISRMGLKNTVVLNESPENIAKRFINYFDKILVDAPCSGEGMFRKHPEVVNEWSLDNVHSCAERQLNILNTIKNSLKPGGILVYSTCTFSPDEDECVIEQFLLENPNFKLLPIENKYFSSGIKLNTKNNLEDIEKTVRIFPHISKGEGHFVAKLQKTSSDNDFTYFKTQKSNIDSKFLKLYKQFEKDYLNTELKGLFLQFGNNIYLCPPNTPDLNNIKVVYSGLLLGNIENNRFTPSHELAIYLKDAKQQIELTYNETLSYMAGNTLNTDLNVTGWVLLTLNSNPVGWGKISNGIIKNHYPKYLRTK